MLKAPVCGLTMLPSRNLSHTRLFPLCYTYMQSRLTALTFIKTYSILALDLEGASTAAVAAVGIMGT